MSWRQISAAVACSGLVLSLNFFPLYGQESSSDSPALPPLRFVGSGGTAGPTTSVPSTSVPTTSVPTTSVPATAFPTPVTSSPSAAVDPPSLPGGGLPPGASSGSGLSPSVGSLSGNSGPASRGLSAVSPRLSGITGDLPSGAGQVLKSYDLRLYTGALTQHDQPHQAILDWVLRDTGTDMWFGEPFGFLHANRDSLSVYHTPEIQGVVAAVVEKFLQGVKEPQAIGLRVITLGNPNWRARALPLMENVNVATPGVQAWLASKENAAVLIAQLRARSDAREVQSLDLGMYNGQAESLVSTRRRNYARSVRPVSTGWPPYQPETGEVAEGYQLEISPLLHPDGKTLDCVIRANIDQVEKLVPVDLDFPLPNGQMHRARIEVPQIVSWKLHERFRWPADRVLILSCGVIASPDRPAASIPLLNFEAFTGQTAGRADALLFVEFKGRASENIPLGSRVASPDASFNRGRY